MQIQLTLITMSCTVFGEVIRKISTDCDVFTDSHMCSQQSVSFFCRHTQRLNGYQMSAERTMIQQL